MYVCVCLCDVGRAQVGSAFLTSFHPAVCFVVGRGVSRDVCCCCCYCLCYYSHRVVDNQSRSSGVKGVAFFVVVEQAMCSRRLFAEQQLLLLLLRAFGARSRLGECLDLLLCRRRYDLTTRYTLQKQRRMCAGLGSDLWSLLYLNSLLSVLSSVSVFYGCVKFSLPIDNLIRGSTYVSWQPVFWRPSRCYFTLAALLSYFVLFLFFFLFSPAPFPRCLNQGSIVNRPGILFTNTSAAVSRSLSLSPALFLACFLYFIFSFCFLALLPSFFGAPTA